VVKKLAFELPDNEETVPDSPPEHLSYNKSRYQSSVDVAALQNPLADEDMDEFRLWHRLDL